MKTSRFAALCAAVGLAVVLGTSYASAGEHFNISLIPSPRKAKQYLEVVQWERYEGTRINVAQEKAWEDTAFFFDLKGDEWKVEFPNDRFYHPTRQHYGDLADPRPMKGDLQKAALELLERDLVHVYRVWAVGGKKGPEVAIVMTPYNIKAGHNQNTIFIRLDESGLQAREGDEPEHDLSFLGRGRLGKMMRGRRRGHRRGGKKGTNDLCTIDAVPDPGSVGNQGTLGLDSGIIDVK